MLAGCAATPQRGGPDALFADDRFGTPRQPVSAADLFTLSEPMLVFAETQMAALMGERGLQGGLIAAISQRLRIDPATAATRPAAETFDARSGNCLSLVIMTAAFARHFDIPFEYQSVHGEGAWSRAAGIAFHSGHVNLKLGPRATESFLRRMPVLVQTVDFLEPEDAARRRVRAIPEGRIVAMYLNNRAAESLVEGDLDGAYAWTRAAIVADPAFTAAYNTLGVVYRRHGDADLAERALQVALEREPQNAHALSNLAVTLEELGRPAEARRVRTRLAAVAPYPPFHFLDQGLAAAQRGEYRRALQLFERELERMPYDAELHFAIAVTELRLGQRRDAQRHASLALENSTTQDRRSLYAAKLDRLELLRRP